MSKRYLYYAFVFFVWVLHQPVYGQVDLSQMDHHEGFIDFYWQDSTGKLYLDINRLNEEILYNTGLSAGIGSNDIGLDRGQLGGEHVIVFRKSGNKILMVEQNLGYRANSDDSLEQRAVREAFAQSVLFGFQVVQQTEGGYLVDASNFLLQDMHGVSRRLASTKQGSYQVDLSRSAVYLPRTKNFPKNTELEATITLKGEPKGSYIRSVVPSPEAVTVRQHHSFIALPDDDFEPRVFDPRSGYFALKYQDYATPIDEKIMQRLIYRHRLKKKHPEAEKSEPVEPIVYYLDSGTPEPIRSALLEGASWWNQAFEAAGYIDAFQVRMMPADADPMDVRYNLIQWVHRSTRGWSYGSSVSDPRTGEIIKGHVSLGSLRVRQDYLIAQGLLSVFKGENDNDPLVQLALARLRQLSAHEVGHTLGLAHNFAASTNDRASVMDYPHPHVALVQGAIDFSEAYAVGIGAWDQRTILYGYQDFADNVDVDQALQSMLAENDAMGLRYISDQDARPAYGAHPHAHLWDNGASVVEELERMMKVRAHALEQFGLDNIPDGTPLADLENVLVPLYLSHRYQAEAVSKLIGGLEYTYAVKGTGATRTSMVDATVQRNALNALIGTLDPAYLTLPEHIVELIPPQPIGYERDREMFKVRTGLTFDPVSAAEASAEFVLAFTLQPQRLARVVEHHARNTGQLSLDEIFDKLQDATSDFARREGLEGVIGQTVRMQYVRHLMALAMDKTGSHLVSGAALQMLDGIRKQGEDDAHSRQVRFLIEQFFADPEDFALPPALDLPDGSPIGCSAG